MSPSARRNVLRLTVLAIATASAVALAAVSPLLIDLFLNGYTVTVSTNNLPKGWFAQGNNMDRAKTDLRTVCTIGATSCSLALQSALTMSSVDGGTFTAVFNNSGNTVNAYAWSGSMDLTGYENHWHNYVRCSGAIEIVGCNEPTPVTMTTTAYNKNGNCMTYVNDAGSTVCVSDTDTVLLPAVQDPDVVELCPLPTTDECGIGACQSACQADCNSRTYFGTPEEQHEARRECHKACECQCKLEVRLGTECAIEPKCLVQ